jgi:transcriptional regulator with XRE-family HTH domain
MPKRVKNRLKPEPRRTFIREWRETAGLSQDKLVERVREHLEGFSKSTLSRLENGRQPYTQPMIEAIATALGCTPADLITRKPDAEIWSIMDTLQSLPPEEQQTIIRMIDGLRRAS